ncbi:MAG TPA: hypothetical protein VM054_02230 [bacterium]|nr:hypothetical protein [bacterium]
MRASVFAALAAVVFLVSCSTGTGGEEGVPHDQTTVLGTLNLFLDVWNDCDIDTYKGLLDEDTFTFYFDPSDMGGEHDIPPSWGYTEEITAVTNLFEYVGAENIDVELDLEGVTEPEEDVVTYTARDIPYHVRVYVEAEEHIIYLAVGLLDMELMYADGGWVITDWWDKVPYRLLVAETTWGAIKACF